MIKRCFSIKFIEFETLVPDLQDFTVCYWLKSVNTTNRQSTFSYSGEVLQVLDDPVGRVELNRFVFFISPPAPGDPQAISIWIEPTIFGTQIRLTMREVEVHSVPYAITSHHWYHMCHSWEGASGRWLLYVDGDLVASGMDTNPRPRFIPGRGTVVFGQQQNNFDLSPDRPGGFQAASGIEGEMTLAFFDSRPLRHNLASFGASGNFDGEILGSKLTSDISLSWWGLKEIGRSCFDQPPGNIVAWGTTSMKLFGGATIANAKPSCGDF